MIEISHLTKVYGKKKAVDDISFTVNKGEVLGFLGPNGAGKSTTMNIITGYISSTSGSVKVDGHDILEEPNEVKKRIGYLPEIPPLYTDMVVKDYLDFVYDLKKIKGKNKKEHIQSVMDIVKIDDVKNRKIANLSKGYKQRVGLAQALLGDPEVLILDEPTVGLDPKQIIEIRNVIKDLGQARTIILSSHILPEISAVCERVIIINKGKLIAEDTPENLARNFAQNKKMQIRVLGDENVIAQTLDEMMAVTDVVPLGQKEDGAYDFEISIDSSVDGDFNKNLFLQFAQKQLPILMQKEIGASLEDIFIQLTENLDGEQPVEDYSQMVAEIQENESSDNTQNSDSEDNAEIQEAKEEAETDESDI